MTPSDRLRAELAKLAPTDGRWLPPDNFQDDEARWFERAEQHGVVEFTACTPDCPHFGKPGRHQFRRVPTQRPRHLFSLPGPSLNREYIPHIAAYARAILDYGYDRRRSAFSYYRTYKAERLLTKNKGDSFESDGEFWDCDDSVYLQIEAKAKARQLEAIVRQIDQIDFLQQMPLGVKKEIEYVLELRPKFLWLVAPGSIDPARFVYRVAVDGLTATFQRVPDVPPPPLATTSEPTVGYAAQ